MKHIQVKSKANFLDLHLFFSMELVGEGMYTLSNPFETSTSYSFRLFKNKQTILYVEYLKNK